MFVDFAMVSHTELLEAFRILRHCKIIDIDLHNESETPSKIVDLLITEIPRDTFLGPLLIYI